MYRVERRESIGGEGDRIGGEGKLGSIKEEKMGRWEGGKRGRGKEFREDYSEGGRREDI